jgi:DNA polymerase III subunit epsilon
VTSGRTALAEVRWVVIDCETSGLDAKRDRLLSLGAVSVRGRRIALADAYGAVIRQAQASARENIAIHGIGAEAQRAGRPAEEALRELAAFAADAVPAAFHAPFDAEVLRRALKAAGAPPLPRRWLDLAQLAPALYPQAARAQRALEDWLAHFGIAPRGRHDALGDALATAELLLVLLEEADRQGAKTLGELLAIGPARRWLA